MRFPIFLDLQPLRYIMVLNRLVNRFSEPALYAWAWDDKMWLAEIHGIWQVQFPQVHWFLSSLIQFGAFNFYFHLQVQTWHTEHLTIFNNYQNISLITIRIGKNWGAWDIIDSTSKELNITLLLELVQKLHFSEISKVATQSYIIFQTFIHIHDLLIYIVKFPKCQHIKSVIF